MQSMKLSLAVTLLVLVPLASEATFQWLMQPYQPTAFGGSYFQMAPPIRPFLPMAAFPSYNYHLPSRSSYSSSLGSRLVWTRSGTSSRWQLASGAQPPVVYRPPRPVTIPAPYPPAVPPSPSRSRVRTSAPTRSASVEPPAPSRPAPASVPTATRSVAVNQPRSELAALAVASSVVSAPRQTAPVVAPVPIVAPRPPVSPVAAPAELEREPAPVASPETPRQPRPVVSEPERAMQPTMAEASPAASGAAPSRSSPVAVAETVPVAPLVVMAEGPNPDIGFDSPRASALEMNPLLPPTTDPSEGFERANSSGVSGFTENLEPDE